VDVAQDPDALRVEEQGQQGESGGARQGAQGGERALPEERLQGSAGEEEEQQGRAQDEGPVGVDPEGHQRGEGEEAHRTQGALPEAGQEEIENREGHPGPDLGAQHQVVEGHAGGQREGQGGQAAGAAPPPRLPSDEGEGHEGQQVAGEGGERKPPGPIKQGEERLPQPGPVGERRIRRQGPAEHVRGRDAPLVEDERPDLQMPPEIVRGQGHQRDQHPEGRQNHRQPEEINGSAHPVGPHSVSFSFITPENASAS
jgi:hypothetical protein